MKRMVMAGLAIGLGWAAPGRAEEPVAAGAPAVEAAQLERLRLEAERARLAAERAAFEAEKAAWAARQGGAGVAAPAVTSAPPPAIAATPPPPRVDDLYICTDEVRLYRNRNLAGDLEPMTVVSARPHATQGWLVLQRGGVSYEAESNAFAREADITESLNSRIRQAESSLRSKQSELDAARARRSALEDRIATLEAQARSTIIVQQPFPPASNAAPTTVVVSDSGVRSFINQLDNELRKLKKDLAAREAEAGRLAAELERARAALERVGGAFRLYRSASRG
jgi:hypothetical protein